MTGSALFADSAARERLENGLSGAHASVMDIAAGMLVQLGQSGPIFSTLHFPRRSWLLFNYGLKSCGRIRVNSLHQRRGFAFRREGYDPR